VRASRPAGGGVLGYLGVVVMGVMVVVRGNGYRVMGNGPGKYPGSTKEEPREVSNVRTHGPGTLVRYVSY